MWDDARGSGPGIRIAGHDSGDLAATIQQVEVIDPIFLSRQYPDEMPAARDVLKDK